MNTEKLQDVSDSEDQMWTEYLADGGSPDSSKWAFEQWIGERYPDPALSEMLP